MYRFYRRPVIVLVFLKPVLSADKKIGKGQFSEVYKAKLSVDDSTVALKKVQVWAIYILKVMAELWKNFTASLFQDEGKE